MNGMLQPACPEEIKDQITFEQFKEALNIDPLTSQVHTFKQAGMMLMGAELSLEYIIDAVTLKGAILSLAGRHAIAMAHGLVINLENEKPIFCAHEPERFEKLLATIKKPEETIPETFTTDELLESFIPEEAL